MQMVFFSWILSIVTPIIMLFVMYRVQLHASDSTSIKCDCCCCYAPAGIIKFEVHVVHHEAVESIHSKLESGQEFLSS